jgi:prepilin-type N-terminal cleavage/methylation domain-containing protein
MRTFSPSSRRSSLKPLLQGRGFTLIELLVVVALIVLITAAVLVRQARFDSSTLLRSLSYSIAITVRSAQVYGTSVLGVQSGGNTVFAPAYGVYFSNASSYLLFADINGNGVYDVATDAIVQTYQVGAGFQISKFCATPTGAPPCSTGAGPLTWITIVFRRPNPDACVASSAQPGVCAPGAAQTYSGAYVQVASVNDPTNTHSINVSSTGEIAVGASGT